MILQISCSLNAQLICNEGLSNVTNEKCFIRGCRWNLVLSISMSHRRYIGTLKKKHLKVELTKKHVYRSIQRNFMGNCIYKTWKSGKTSFLHVMFQFCSGRHWMTKLNLRRNRNNLKYGSWFKFYVPVWVQGSILNQCFYLYRWN